MFTKRQPGAGTRALGWDTCNDKGSCGQYLSENAYGHTGYTGTSIWIDPDRDMFVVLLTNRVHEAKAKRPAKVIADVRADLADAAALSVTDYADGPMVMPAKFRADRAVDWNKPVRKPRRTRKHTTAKKSSAHKSTSSKKASSSKAKASHTTHSTHSTKKKSTAKKPAAKSKG
jgi:CubicO group peptidase (beta-lactamase class C family)